MWTLFACFVCLDIGVVGMYFLMRKFPQYFHIDDMIKAKKVEILAEVNAKKDITVEEIKKLLDKI